MHDINWTYPPCRWLGVEKIYLMENVETPTAHFVQQIQDFVDDGLIVYSFKGSGGYQSRWYHECMSSYHSEHNWLAFIDVDEYIVLQDEYEPPLSANCQNCPMKMCNIRCSTRIA